jgi:hypothetical protein
MTAPNNQEKVAAKIENMNLEGVVSVVWDDGSVIVDCANEATANTVMKKFGGRVIGDGVQRGGLYVTVKGEEYDHSY